MSSPRDYYEILGVGRDASEAELKSAYRRLALEHHPDRNPGSAEAVERFREASEAYAVLSDPEKRSRYDRFGHAGFSGGAGFGGFDPSVFADFSDLFGEFFGFSGGAAASRETAGSDLVYRMTISLRVAAFGVEAPIVVSRLERCEECGGSGAEPGSRPRTCPTCGGRGRQHVTQGFLMITRPCGRCGGDGKILERPCKRCRGEGRQRGERKLAIRIPPGVETGSRLRLTGEGDVGPAGGRPGDLYVVLTVEEDEVFQREGEDLVLLLELPYPTLVLGGEIEIPTLEAKEKITVPPGTQVDSEVRLRGKGFGRLGRGGRGDLVVRMRTLVPRSPSEEEKELLRRYASLVGAPVGNKGVFHKAKKIFS